MMTDFDNIQQARVDLIETEDERARKAMLYMLEDLEQQRLELEQVQQEWLEAIDTLEDPIFLHDGEFKIMRANKAFQGLVNMKFKHFIGRPYYDVIPGLDAPFANCLSTTHTHHADVEEYSVNGKIYKNRAYPIKDASGSYRHSIHILEDITLQRVQNRALTQLNRQLKTISRCNEVLVQATTEEELLNNLCNAIVSEGGYDGAWVGYLEGDAHDTLSLVAQAGDKALFEPLKKKITLQVEPPCPIVVAIQTSSVKLIDNFFERQSCFEYTPEFAKAHPNNLLILPLVSGKLQLGALGVYVEAEDSVTEESAELFKELSADLTYGITTLRTRNRFKETAEQLIQQEKLLDKITASVQDALIMIESSGNIEFWNEAAEHIFGYTHEEAIGQNIHELIAPDQDQSSITEGFKLFAKTGKGKVLDTPLELEAHHKNGNTIPVELLISSVNINGAWHAVGVIRDATERKQMVTRLKQSLLGTIHAVSKMVEARDPYTAGHQERVAQLAEAIAHTMELDDDRIEGIKIASMVHDIGKIQVPSEILSMPRKLTELEYGMIKTHTQTGYDILKAIDFSWPVAEMVYQHHEKLDGSGYPRGLKYDEILLEAQIICVADVVEAMASHRPYRPGLGVTAAMDEISKNREIHYRSDVVDACINLFTEKGFEWKVQLNNI